MKVMIDTKDLQKGMYVSELDRPWLESPFLFQGFRITNTEELNLLAETCEYVFVETEKSAVEIPEHLSIMPMRSEDSKQKIKSYIKKPKPYTTSFEKEYPKAKHLYKKAQKKVHGLYNDIRVGKSLNVREVKDTVTTLVDSVIRHPDALLLLAMLQDRTDKSITHAVNVCTLAVTFGRSLGFDKEQLTELGLGALLHDVGEVKVPKEVLQDFANCDQEDIRRFQDHTSYGAAILHNTQDLPASAINIARDHHERANGTGYPQNLKMNQLDVFTMIVAIVDVYDNVTSGMYGIPAMSCTEALKNIYVWREDLFDPLLVERFIQCLGIYPLGSIVELNSGDIGIVISINPDTRLFPKIMLVRNSKKVPISPPSIMNLSLFRASHDRKKFEIKRVLQADECNIDVRDYILREMPLDVA